MSPEIAEHYARYARDISRPYGPLDQETVRNYRSRVRRYLGWLALTSMPGDPLAEPAARDRAVRDYRDWLITVAKRKPTTVNAHLAAVDDFYRRLGLGPTQTARRNLREVAPRVLTRQASARWLRAVNEAGVRDRALALTEFYAGTRRAETIALDLDDLHLSSRKGNLTIGRDATGGHRVVPLHPELRVALQAWLYERARLPASVGSPALFLNYRGDRLTVRGAYKVLKAIAEEAGLSTGHHGELTPHVIRRTAATGMVRDGKDAALVADILGVSLPTTRRGLLAGADE